MQRAILSAKMYRLFCRCRAQKRYRYDCIANNAMLHTLTLRLLDLESWQDVYLSVAVNPTIFRQKATRASVTQGPTAGLSREHCLGSAGPTDFHLSADKPLKELRHPLSEYDSRLVVSCQHLEISGSFTAKLPNKSGLGQLGGCDPPASEIDRC